MRKVKLLVAREALAATQMESEVYASLADLHRVVAEVAALTALVHFVHLSWEEKVLAKVVELLLTFLVS